MAAGSPGRCVPGRAVPTKAGCHQDCNLCTQICPTAAIRPLALEEKRRTHMGLVKVNIVSQQQLLWDHHVVPIGRSFDFVRRCKS